MFEHHFQCPYCWETISMFLESIESEQHYVEDCEVCCNPIQIQYATANRMLIRFDANSIEQ